MHSEYKVGIIGAGSFPMFSVKAFLKPDGIGISGVYDTNSANAQKFAKEFNCKIFSDISAILANPEIDIIYIATPPFLHYQQSKEALLAGKHVICEKPAALKSDEVAELISIAVEKKLLYVVNLMQRYNPLYKKMQEIINSGILGDFIHGYFENYASNETLDPAHWMWDEKLSGGIFIEHAVHFFDMFEGWLGKGRVVSSQKINNPNTDININSEVQAIVKYDHGLVNFYHGFTQPSRMDRQEMKFLFELGDVTLFEWVPVQMTIRALVTEETKQKLIEIFPDGDSSIIDTYTEDEKHFKSQFKERKANQLIKMEIGKDSKKLDIYEKLLTDMLKDQLAWVNNRDHERKVTDKNAYNSVKIAEEASGKAIQL